MSLVAVPVGLERVAAAVGIGQSANDQKTELVDSLDGLASAEQPQPDFVARMNRYALDGDDVIHARQQQLVAQTRYGGYRILPDWTAPFAWED